MQSPKAFTLAAHGAKMPAIGFGTMELPLRPAELVAAAIAAGYRHIDTARKYGTEERVGEGIRASGIARNELFVTTKVTEENAREADFFALGGDEPEGARPRPCRPPAGALAAA